MPIRLVLALAALALVAPARAQSGDPVERLAAALSLSADQADLVAEVFDARDPASTWTLAAELVPTLSDSQRAALMARPERTDGGERARRGGRRARGDARPQRDPARRAVVQAARDAALGLDAEQSERLDAALGGMDRREAMTALRDGIVPDDVADVLTDEQAELWQAQTMLQRHLRSGRRADR